MSYSVDNVATFRGLEVDNGVILDYESFNSALDEQGPINITGIEFYPSYILEKMDPIAYNLYCGYFFDELQCELEKALDDGDYSEIEWINEPEDLE